MTARHFTTALRQLRRGLARPDAGGVTDAELLQRFVSQRDEAAFELLVWRHGPMVLGLCRRLMRHEQDAEDAFQATLLALARKAGSIGKGGSLGSWLYKVAYRVALRARAAARRRARRERPVAEFPAVADWHGPADLAGRELAPVLDEELSRLPEKYRAPVVLCYLEGLTNEAAARQLGWPAGTVKTRLACARRLLGTGLARRGLTLGAGLLAAEVLPPAAPAAVPVALAVATTRAAASVVAGEVTAAGAVSTHVVSLTEGVLRAMTLMKLKMAVVALVAGLAVAGVGVASYQALAAAPGDSCGLAPAQGAPGRVEQIKKRIAELQEELRHAEEAAARDPAAARQAPVAFIFGDSPITRSELGDYLLRRRLSPEQLQQYINLRILEHAARAKGLAVTDQEVEAAYAADRKAYNGNSPEEFDEAVRRHKTLAAWKEDVIRPRLLLEKLCRGRVHVTEQDLRNAYEAHYGDKVECQMIRWPVAEKEKAERLYALLRDNEAEFTRAAGRQPTPSLAATGGRLPPFGRHSLDREGLEKAAFRLQPGEISPLIETPEGFVVVKCLRRIPADASQRFEEVRASLQKEVLDRLVQQETVTVFKELKEQARPRVLWTPEGAGQPTVP